MNDRVVPIDVACNDDHGNESGRAHAIHFPGLELDARALAGVRFRVSPGAFWVSRRKWNARHVASHVGNIYWERFGMGALEAAVFLSWLRESELFQLDGGHHELFTWFESGIADGVVGRAGTETYLSRLLLTAASEDCL